MTPMSPGHVFIIHGDLRSLAADDVLVPCDERLNVTRAFEALVAPTVPGDGPWVRPGGVEAPSEFGNEGRMPLLVRTDQGHDAYSAGPRVWLVNTAAPETPDGPGLNWLLRGIRNALLAVADRPAEPLNERARPIIAMPLVGIGAGGFEQLRADVIQRLLGELHEFCAEDGHPDVVLVLWDRSDFDAFQSLRLQPPLPDGISPDQFEELARQGHTATLTPFLGAGVSRAAGLPAWSALLEDLAFETNHSPRSIEELQQLPLEDQAQVLEAWLRPKDIRLRIADLLDRSNYSLSHALIASARFPNAITTNYDALYEMACTVPHGRLLRVLPREPVQGDAPWLLKLHGDVQQPESIVVTRTHYFESEAMSVPLAAIVQAFMLTRHLLIVGYSMSDVDFMRFARQASKVPHTSANRRLGTVLSSTPSGALQDLWRDQFNVVDLSADGAIAFADATRSLEIVLDRLNHALKDGTGYLLDRRYAPLLGREDSELVLGLQRLGDLRSASGPLASRLRETLSQMEWKPGDDAATSHRP